MRIYSLNELQTLPCAQLFRLYARIVTTLPQLPDGSYARHVAQTNLHNIGHALTRPMLRPG